MKWIVHEETAETRAWQESEAGRIEQFGTSGWDAWANLPSPSRPNGKTKTKHKIGECYPSAEAARAAVLRAYRKYSPFRAE
jgi:hypothetical protein